MLKRKLIEINRELKKVAIVRLTTLKSISPDYSIAYIEGDFKKGDSNLLKEMVESFSNKKIEVIFMFPEFLYKDDECIVNECMITVGVKKL